jgi:hypothetical protein
MIAHRTLDQVVRGQLLTDLRDGLGGLLVLMTLVRAMTANPESCARWLVSSSVMLSAKYSRQSVR